MVSETGVDRRKWRALPSFVTRSGRRQGEPVSGFDVWVRRTLRPCPRSVLREDVISGAGVK